MKERLLLPETFIRNLKNKIYNYVTSTSKNMFLDELDDRVNDNNNQQYKTKVKPTDGKSSTNFDFDVESNGENSKFKVGDHVRI